MDFRFIKTLTDAPPVIVHFPEGATENFENGQCVVVGNDGYLRECADAEAIITGVAAGDASYTATDGLVSCPVYVGNQSIFRAAGKAVLAQLNVGDYADLDVTGGVHQVDNEAVSGAAGDCIFRIVDIVGTIAAAGHCDVIIIHGLDSIHTETDPPAA